MKQIKTMIIVSSILGFVFLLACLIIGSMGINELSNRANTQDSLYKSMVGKKIFLDKDSITIIDYSILNSTFTLSNGKEVSEGLVLAK